MTFTVRHFYEGEKIEMAGTPETVCEATIVVLGRMKFYQFVVFGVTAFALLAKRFRVQFLVRRVPYRLIF